MLGLNNKKGFTLIEALCSVSLFSILLLFAVEIKTNEIRLNKINYETIKYTYFLDALKKELISNASEQQIIDLESKGEIYVIKEKIENEDSILDVSSIFSAVNDENKFPYVILHSQKENDNFKVVLTMHVKFYGKEKIYTCTFVK